MAILSLNGRTDFQIQLSRSLPKVEIGVMADEKEIAKFPDSGDFILFLEQYLLPNRPCIFSSVFTRSWRAREEWRNTDDTPNITFLRDNFGDAVVPVADCSQSTQYSSHTKTSMTVREYTTLWTTSHTHSLYLKDWHFARDFPEYVAYSVPDCFQSDWLNEVWPTRLDVPPDDYRFVYLGPKGTWTPFHADVFRSYSWSANVCGRKEWLFLPPGEEDLLRDKFGHLPVDLTSSELDNRELYPTAYRACKPIRVVQESGEIIFVPSGWHHQVRNIEDTLSINHNWTNVCGVDYMWTHLQSELALVQKELEDCREMEQWEEQCQVVLKASAGMDYWDFTQLLCFVAVSRLNHLQATLPSGHWSQLQLDSLHTLIHKTLSNSSKTVTFLKTMLEFEASVMQDGIDSVLHSLKNSNEAKRKLLELLPSSLVSRVTQDISLCNHNVLYKLYELNTIEKLIRNVVI